MNEHAVTQQVMCSFVSCLFLRTEILVNQPQNMFDLSEMNNRRQTAA